MYQGVSRSTTPPKFQNHLMQTAFDNIRHGSLSETSIKKMGFWKNGEIEWPSGPVAPWSSVTAESHFGAWRRSNHPAQSEGKVRRPQPHANETALVVSNAAANANQQTHRESVCSLFACACTSASVCLSSLPSSSIHSSLERGHVFVYLRGFMLPCRLCVFDVCLPVTVHVLCESTCVCVCERPQDLATAEDPAEAKHRCLFIDLVGPECLYVIQ